jgi:hypothetical protein
LHSGLAGGLAFFISIKAFSISLLAGGSQTEKDNIPFSSSLSKAACFYQPQFC